MTIGLTPDAASCVDAVVAACRNHEKDGDNVRSVTNRHVMQSPSCARCEQAMIGKLGYQILSGKPRVSQHYERNFWIEAER